MPLKPAGDIRELLRVGDFIQGIADDYKVRNVFDDSGYKTLLLLKYFGLVKIEGRQGDDVLDQKTGKHYEMKTVNLLNAHGQFRRNPGITTCHHVNTDVITRYRKVEARIIGVFFGHRPARIYEMPTAELEQFFSAWEKQLTTRTHINNPKIPFPRVVDLATCHFWDKDYDQCFT
ncbi:MAG: hypothetical protein M0031_03200 [Thermaerobacter sp.]|nr:hypothetical protein [Thermaerobacter sp.]